MRNAALRFKLPRMVLVVLTSLLISCGGSDQVTQDLAEEVPEETAEAMETAEEYLKTQEVQIRDQVAADLEDLRDRISDLHQQADKAAAAVERSWNQSIADLERRVEELRKNQDAISKEVEKAWDDFVAQASRTVHEIQERLEGLLRN